jgi:mutator protein MutT
MTGSEKPKLRVVAGVAFRGGRMLVAKRLAGKPYPLLWEFPGGKVEEGEEDRDALRREVREELGVEARVGSEIGSCVHEYPEKIVNLRFFHIESFSGRPRPIGVAELRWVSPAEAEQLPFLEGDRGFLAKLRTPEEQEKWFS